jgi:ABC-2 type transport system ATP-binding protein
MERQSTPAPALQLEGLTKRFGDVAAVDDLTLTVPTGEIFGFLGPNGAGKSTTIRMLLNLLRPDAGTARIMGVPSTDVATAHRHLGYVPGDVALWPQLTGRETLELLGNVAGRVDVAFRDELVQRLHLDLDKRVRSYSKGNRQKVALVAAFMTRPDVLLLDEPTAGLAQREAEVFGPLLLRVRRDLDATLVVVEHDIPLVMGMSDRVQCLSAGTTIAVGPPEQVRSDPAVIASYLGTDERAIARSGPLA